jgi:peptide/nickel transport system permease protein
MVTYIIRRLILAVVVLFIVTLVVFLLVHIMPGDPAKVMLGTEASEEQINDLRKDLWLDQPIVVQYGHWLFNFVRGDFGRSIMYHEEVITLLKQRIPVTLHLGILGFIFANLIGIPAGIICAIKRGTILDSVIAVTANIGVAIPSFWVGILGIYIFGFQFGILPIQGYTSPFNDFWLSTKQLIMPVFCLAMVPVASIARQTRSAMLEVVRQDYMRTAWAKGLRESTVIMKHALKNALTPVITLSGIQLAQLIGGTVFIETVFNIPGIGRLMVTSIMNKDFIVVQTIIMLLGISVAFVNLIVDIFYSWLDPRIRYD